VNTNRKGRDLTDRQRRRLATRTHGATAVLPPTTYCDFCRSTDVVTCFSTKARVMRVETGTKVTDLVDNGHWGACEPCARLVRLRKIDELAERSYNLASEEIKAQVPLAFMQAIQRGLFWPGWHGLEHPLTDHPKGTVH
jgi:hypothetical protein